jgi:hypothetical protein
VECYNQFCANGADPDFGRAAKRLKPVETPPFIAAILWPRSYNTFGGPKKNIQALDLFEGPFRVDGRLDKIYIIAPTGLKMLQT